jgi:hypothetical protein
MAIALGAIAAWLSYARAASPGQRGRVMVLAALRFAAVVLVAAIALGAPAAPPRVAAPLVAIDASASWRRADGDDSTAVRTLRTTWRQAIRDAGAGSENIVLVGDSLREVAASDVAQLLPDDANSRVRSAVDRASALGRPLLLLSDGEIDDPDALADAPPGSRTVVPARSAKRDLAIAELTVPSAATAGDTLQVAALLVAGGTGTTEGSLQVSIDGAAVGSVAVPTLAPYATTRVTVPLPLPRGARSAIVQAVAHDAGDVEPRNDTLRAAVEVSDRPPAVFVSTAPDLDVREVLVVLRGALSLPTRAYLRVAPNVWREEGSLAPITEADVRARAAAAGMLIVHGDTTWAPKGAGSLRAARALWTPAPPTAAARAGEVARAAEWYAVGAPPSPLAASLSGLPWDSLPPLTLAGPAKGTRSILDAKLGRRGDATSAIAEREDGGMRTLVVSGSGYAGWSMRGGRSAQAFTALWGTIFDWLALGRGDQRAARPVLSAIRSGDPVRWRRGGTDSLVSAIVAPRSGSAPATAATGDSLRLHFTNGAVEAESPPLRPGIYDIRTVGGTAVLVVNASREWVPRAPSVRDGVLSRGSLSLDAPRIADAWWPFVLALLLLCAEWIVRRIVGLR